MGDGDKINGPQLGAVEPADKPLAGYVNESSATLDKDATQRRMSRRP